MNREWIVLIVLVYADSVWAQPPAQPVVTEIDGFWRLTSQQRDIPPGVREWDVLMADALFVSEGHCSKVTLDGTFPNGAQRRPIAVDATTSPKTLDFKFGNFDWLAIYKIEDGVMTVATKHSAETRPTLFTTSPDAGAGRAYHVYVFKQIKETAEEAKAKAVGPLDPKTQNLDGLWVLDKTEVNAMRGGNDPEDHEALYFEGTTGLLANKDGWHGKGAFRFNSNPQATPPTIEAKFNRGPFRGIYVIAGDELTIASNGSNAELPRWFSTSLKAGAGRADVLRRYRRVQPTSRIVQLIQLSKLDAAKQSLDGLWCVEYDKHHGLRRAPEAWLIERGKWLPAAQNGTLLTSSELDRFTIAAADATKPTPTIDLIAANGDRIFGIYKVEGDRLYLAANNRDEERPKSFTTNLTAGPARAQRVILLRRGDTSVNQTCVPAPAPEPISADLVSPLPKPRPLPPGELNGYWKLEKVATNGRNDWRAWWEHAVYVDGRIYHFVQEDGLIARKDPAVVRIDATTSPKTIVYQMHDVTWRGIYKIDGKKLIVATNFLADRWPSEFPADLLAKIEAKPQAKPETKPDGKPALKPPVKTEVKPQPKLDQSEQIRVYSRVEEGPELTRQKTPPTLDASTQRLDGFWVLKEHEQNPTRDVGDYPYHWEEAIYVEGNWLQFADKSGRLMERPIPIRSDPGAAPPTLDVTRAGKPWLAIYKVEGDRLTIAYGGPNAERPRWFTTKFAAGLGRANFLRVYVRVRPSEEVVHLTSKVKLDKAKQKLDGLWIVQKKSQNGSVDGEFRVDEAIYFEEGRWHSASKAGLFTKAFEATYHSDSSSETPKIDVTTRKSKFRGIYKVEGDTLYLAFSFANDARPCVFTADLTAGPGRATFAAVLKRAAPPAK